MEWGRACSTKKCSKPGRWVQQGPIPKCNWVVPILELPSVRARASFTGCCFLKSQLIVLKTGSNSQLLIPPKKMPELVSELDSTTSYRSGIFPLPRSRRRRVFENIQYEASFENIPYRGLWLVVIAVLPIPYSPSPPPPRHPHGRSSICVVPGPP